jgi:hypothetical protein
LARADLEQISSGRLPASNGFRVEGTGAKTKVKEGRNGE